MQFAGKIHFIGSLHVRKSLANFRIGSGNNWEMMKLCLFINNKKNVVGEIR